MKKLLVKIKVRFDIGRGLLNYFSYIFYGYGIKEVFGNNFVKVFVAGLLFIAASFLLGFFYIRFKLMLMEQEYLTRELNPFFKKIEKDINSKNKY